jgi:hypothetical protein
MLKSEKISAQFELVLNHLESADFELQKLPSAEFGSGVFYEIHNKIQGLLEEIEELHYETVCPIQVEENEREEEIRVLERRLAELKSRE